MILSGQVSDSPSPPVGPTVAERARTALAAAPTLAVTAFGTDWTVLAHGTDAAGRLLLLFPERPLAQARPAVGASAERAVVNASRLHVIRLPDRVRCRIQVRGTIAPVASPEHVLPDGGDPARLLDAIGGHTLVRIEPAQVLLDGSPVPLTGYRAAAPDPLHPFEIARLEDLLYRRQQDLAWLCTLLGPEPVVDATEIAPIELDRYGLTIRVTTPRGHADHRLPFPFPVDRSDVLDRVLRRLVGFARSACC